MADAGSGQGLAEALTGAALSVMPNTTRTLLDAAEAAGAKRAVLLSIVNSDQSDYGYYKVEAQRDELYRHAGVATTILYATQFHDLIASMFSGVAKMGLIPSFSGVSFQPIATADAARALVDAAVGGGAVGEGDRRWTRGPHYAPARAATEDHPPAEGPGRAYASARQLRPVPARRTQPGRSIPMEP